MEELLKALELLAAISSERQDNTVARQAVMNHQVAAALPGYELRGRCRPDVGPRGIRDQRHRQDAATFNKTFRGRILIALGDSFDE